MDPTTSEKVQQTLIENGFTCGDDPTNKVFGPASVAALKDFQASHVYADGHPLVVDGVVGPKTLWALDNPSAEQGTPPVLTRTGSKLVALASLDGAISENALDVHEVPNGSNRGPRIDVYTGLLGQPSSRLGPSWCAFFVSYNFKVGGGGTSPFGLIEGAQNIGNWGKEHGYAVEPSAGAQPGDIFIIDNGPVHGHCGHVYSGGGFGIVTVEGNSANRVRSLTRPLSGISLLVRVPG